MRARSALVLSMVLAAFIGCRNSTSTPSNGQPNGADPSARKASDDPNVDVGAKLYSLAGPPSPPMARPAGGEPIVIPNCYVQYEDRQQVSAEVEGMLELIGTPLTQCADGQYVWEQQGEAPVVYDPAHPHPSIIFHPRDKLAYPNNKEKWHPYWKLSDGMTVKADQILCLLDDQLIMTKRDTAKEIRKASYAVHKQAGEGVELVRRKIELYKKNPDAIAEAQKIDDLTQPSRFLENLAQANQAIAKSDQEVAESEITLRKYQIRSRVDGIIRAVAKHPGEYVRPGEKIFEIQSTEKVRLEGTLDSEYERRPNRNMVVSIEPAIPSAPLVTNRGHRQEVGGLAVTGHAKRPLVVSAGLDGFVIVWDPNIANAADQAAISHNLPHPVPAGAVACTPPGAPPCSPSPGPTTARSASGTSPTRRSCRASPSSSRPTSTARQ